jgi:hypothetical protein
MTTRTGIFRLRLPLSLKAAVEAISERDGTSMWRRMAGSSPAMTIEQRHRVKIRIADRRPVD